MNNNDELIFCAGDIRVYKDPTKEQEDSYSVRCVSKDGKTTEPNWSLAIYNGYLLMILVGKK